MVNRERRLVQYCVRKILDSEDDYKKLLYEGDVNIKAAEEYRKELFSKPITGVITYQDKNGNWSSKEITLETKDDNIFIYADGEDYDSCGDHKNNYIAIYIYRYEIDEEMEVRIEREEREEQKQKEAEEAHQERLRKAKEEQDAREYTQYLELQKKFGNKA